METWMQEEIDSLFAEFGTVPPPWVIYRDHPYSMRWRMGDGEGHMQIWHAWWPQQNLEESERIAYFLKYPPPHCWLAFMIQAIWGIDRFEEAEKLPEYFRRTAELGLGNQEDYERDLEDPKWHNL